MSSVVKGLREWFFVDSPKAAHVLAKCGSDFVIFLNCIWLATKLVRSRMEDGCLQENWRDTQHSWLKDVETNDSKRPPFDRLLRKSLEGKSMDKSAFTKLLAIGRDAAVQLVARSPTIGGCHNFHPIIESVSEANTHQIHSNTNDMWVQHVWFMWDWPLNSRAMSWRILFPAFSRMLYSAQDAHEHQKRFLVSWSSSFSRLARCSSPKLSWELWGESNCLHSKFGWHLMTFLFQLFKGSKCWPCWVWLTSGFQNLACRSTWVEPCFDRKGGGDEWADIIICVWFHPEFVWKYGKTKLPFSNMPSVAYRHADMLASCCE